MTRIAFGVCFLVFLCGLSSGALLSAGSLAPNIGHSASLAFSSFGAILLKAFLSFGKFALQMLSPFLFFVGAPIVTGYLAWKALLSSVDYEFNR